MSSSSFNEAILSEKLAKLNASQQSIETLSNWCIFHRKRATHVVQTWKRVFLASPPERRLPLLYLANDILQNSRKKGPEFISEFWTALPPVLQEMVRAGPESARKATLRIVDIWEERKVFGQREDGLRLLLLGPELSQTPASSAAPSPAPARPSPGGASAGEEDASPRGYTSYKAPAKVRGALEKISNAYSSVQDSAKDEETAFRRCSLAVNDIVTLEKDVRSLAHTDSEEQWAPLRDRLSTKIALIGTCCDQLASCEKKRAALVKLLLEALSTQESKLERLRSQLQVGRAHAELAQNLKSKVPPAPAHPSTAPAGGEGTFAPAPAQEYAQAGTSGTASATRGTAAAPLATSTQDVLLDQKRQLAAALAARVAASSSSAAVLSTVLSNLAARGASASAPVSSSTQPGAAAAEQPEKRVRLDEAGAAAPAPGAPLPAAFASPSGGMGVTQAGPSRPPGFDYTASGIPLPPGAPPPGHL